NLSEHLAGAERAGQEPRRVELERALPQEEGRPAGSLGPPLQVHMLSRAARRVRPLVGGCGCRTGRRWRERGRCIMGTREEKAAVPGGRQATAGFTLLELIVTLAILAVVIAMVTPSIGRGTDAVRMRAEVAGFSVMLRHARERAIVSQKPQAVVVDPISQRVSVRVGGPEGEVRE